MSIDLKKLFNSEATDDKAIAKVLLKAFKGNNSKEFDYLRFKHSVDSMISLDLPLETRVKSAFTTAQTMGISKDKLLESIRKYEVVLNKEKRKFADTLKKQMKEKVSDREIRIKELSDKRASIASKMEALKRQQEACANDEKLIIQEINDAKDKIEGARKRFLSVYTHFEDIISSDKEQIENLL